MDVETGTLTPLPVADGDVLEAASCSPFVDERGQRQVVGRWTSRTKDGPLSISHDFGLARYTFPGGEALDRVSTGIVPVGPPCWFPGTRARVLFAACDGALYHLAFEPRPAPLREAGSGPGGGGRPRPVTWRCPMPGSGAVYMNDLSWPVDPRMGGRVVVGLRVQRSPTVGPRSFAPTRLWWLALNHAGTEIVDAGPLVNAEGGGHATEFEERSPTVGTLPDGRMVLAYLRRESASIGWVLRLAPIRIESDGRAPVVLESSGRALADRCQPAHPAPSTDGRWLNVVVGGGSPEGRIRRIPIADALPAPVGPVADASGPTPRS